MLELSQLRNKWPQMLEFSVAMSPHGAQCDRIPRLVSGSHGVEGGMCPESWVWGNWEVYSFTCLGPTLQWPTHEKILHMTSPWDMVAPQHGHSCFFAWAVSRSNYISAGEHLRASWSFKTWPQIAQGVTPTLKTLPGFRRVGRIWLYLSVISILK